MDEQRHEDVEERVAGSRTGSSVHGVRARVWQRNGVTGEARRGPTSASPREAARFDSGGSRSSADRRRDQQPTTDPSAEDKQNVWVLVACVADISYPPSSADTTVRVTFSEVLKSLVSTVWSAYVAFVA